MSEEYRYVFDANEVNQWKYCPICGEEILEVYLGDYFGFISCIGDHGEDETIDFDITWRYKK